MGTIQNSLSEVKVRVPSSVRDDWHGFEEQEIEEKTLFEVVIDLVKTRNLYVDGDEQSVEKILHVMSQIV